MVRRSAILTLLLFTLGIAWDFGPAGADPIPESLRIQREAEKAYQQNRVVPIDRPNAHHRDRLMPENASPLSGNGVGSHVFNQTAIFAGIMDLQGTLREANDLALE